MACLGRIGCLALVVVLAAAGYLTRGLWLDRLPLPGRTVATAPAAGSTWQPLTATGAARARSAVASLNRRDGPVFVNVAGADLAALVMQSLAKQLPAGTDSVEAAVLDDRIAFRAVVPTRELGAAQLGPLAAMLGERERLELSGGLRVVRPGLAELDVRHVKLGNLSLPSAMIPKLIPRLAHGPRPEGLAPTGLPLAIPRYVGDVRVANGHVTLYKTSQGSL